MTPDTSNWSYGAELELADIDRCKKLPEGCGWDTRDFTMVNSNGVAVDPKATFYAQGGEVQTRPTFTIPEQVSHFEELMQLFPEAAVNYRSNLHIHIRVPGLKNNLLDLKKIQRYIHEVFRNVLPALEPIPLPTPVEYPDPEAYQGARKRYTRRRKSHHTFLSPTRVERQYAATSVDEFFKAEVPRSKEGDVMWHAQSRVCVNLRQLLTTDTIEFRHFPGTLDADEFAAALRWCHQFLLRAYAYSPETELMADARAFAPALPQFKPYNHELEKRYLQTVHDGSIKRDQIPLNIERVLKEGAPHHGQSTK